MCDYLKPKRILLIDRDGTINRKAPQGEYIVNWRKFEWIPETVQAMKTLSNDQFRFIVITNQAGISLKKVDPADLEEIHRKMIEELAAEGVDVMKIYVSPHHWNENSFMRKPSPGMFFKAAKEFGLRMDRCMYIGDDERDCLAASNAGCGMVFLSNEGEAPSLADRPVPYFATKALKDSVAQIKDAYLRWEAIA